MDPTRIIQCSVGEFIALANQTLEFAYPSIEIEGEVSSFKVNQGKYVFFDLKDSEGSIGCFMTVWQLRIPIEDGMRVAVIATPKLTKWGKFSITVRSIRPVGEGSLKKSFDLLKTKLDGEGLFASERKRPLPWMPSRIAVISSTEAAGYGDFIKILDDRWGGVHIDVAHVQVQGVGAPEQMIRALSYFNGQEQLPEVIVIVRGGGSADDLAAFNDEPLVRAIASSRVPVLTGIGHEIDESLSDLAADRAASTPSSAAQVLVPNRVEAIDMVGHKLGSLVPRVLNAIESEQLRVVGSVERAAELLGRQISDQQVRLESTRRILNELDPRIVLRRGYALVRGEIMPGNTIEIEKSDTMITAEVRHVSKK